VEVECRASETTQGRPRIVRGRPSRPPKERRLGVFGRRGVQLLAHRQQPTPHRSFARKHTARWAWTSLPYRSEPTTPQLAPIIFRRCPVQATGLRQSQLLVKSTITRTQHLPARSKQDAASIRPGAGFSLRLLSTEDLASALNVHQQRLAALNEEAWPGFESLVRIAGRMDTHVSAMPRERDQWPASARLRASLGCLACHRRATTLTTASLPVAVSLALASAGA
jgi:hypothetical protein